MVEALEQALGYLINISRVTVTDCWWRHYLLNAERGQRMGTRSFCLAASFGSIGYTRSLPVPENQQSHHSKSSRTSHRDFTNKIENIAGDQSMAT